MIKCYVHNYGREIDFFDRQESCVVDQAQEGFFLTPTELEAERRKGFEAARQQIPLDDKGWDGYLFYDFTDYKNSEEYGK